MTKKSAFPYLREIENQALIFLHDYALVAYACFLFSHTVLALLIYQYFPSIWVITWIVSFFIVETVTLFYRRKMPLTDIPHQAKLTRGMLVNIFDGLMVSSCLLFFPYIDDITRMLIITLLLIACTGAIATTVGYRKFYLAFTVPVLSSVVIAAAASATIFDGSSTLLIISAVCLLVTYPLFTVSTAIFQHFREAFAANLRNYQINEELQDAMNEAKRANESKTRFLASASHDLRQPINTLSLFVANLSLKDTDGEHAEIIGHMNTAINSIDAQLESLLDISKLDAGVVKVNRTQTDLVTLIDDLVESYQKQIPDRLKIRCGSKAVNVIINTDVILLERIVTNLIGNAIKYTPKGYIDVSITTNAGRATIKIKDTGIGIEQTELSKIFDEFYQIGNPERSAENGLGLGLSIVKRLADLLNVDLEFSSRHGIGTEVSMILDYETAMEHTLVDETLQLSEISKEQKKVIALDNENAILVAMRSVLETMGHSVETFTDSKLALLSFQENEFDLALIDYRLSGPLAGDDVINQMRRINCNAKYFLVTGDSNIKQCDEDFEVIYKPVTSKKLEHIFNF